MLHAREVSRDPLLALDCMALLSVISAGYAPNSASVAGSRLLTRRHIRLEVERLQAGIARAGNRIIADALAGSTAESTKVDVDLAKAIADRRGADDEARAVVSMAYVMAGMIEGMEMALGRRPQRKSIKKTRVFKDAETGEILRQETVEQVDVYETDLGAVKGLASELAKILLPSWRGTGRADHRGDHRRARGLHRPAARRLPRQDASAAAHDRAEEDSLILNVGKRGLQFSENQRQFISRSRLSRSSRSLSASRCGPLSAKKAPPAYREPAFVLASQEGHWRASGPIQSRFGDHTLGPVQRSPFRQRSAQRPGASRIIWRPR